VIDTDSAVALASLRVKLCKAVVMSVCCLLLMLPIAARNETITIPAEASARISDSEKNGDVYSISFPASAITEYSFPYDWDRGETCT
jgi:hypothetical protein